MHANKITNLISLVVLAALMIVFSFAVTPVQAGEKERGEVKSFEPDRVLLNVWMVDAANMVHWMYLNVPPGKRASLYCKGHEGEAEYLFYTLHTDKLHMPDVDILAIGVDMAYAGYATCEGPPLEPEDTQAAGGST